MQFTIDKKQGNVSVDGVTRTDIDLSNLPSSVDAIRWYGDYGTVDYTLPDTPRTLRKRRVFDFSEFQAVLDLFATPTTELPQTPSVALIAPISPRQIRQALTHAGLRSAVEAAVAAGDQDLKDWYEFATQFERTNQNVIDMGVALGQTPEQLDALWLLGATL